MKTIKTIELSHVVGGQTAAPIQAAQYGVCMNNAANGFAKANTSTVQGFQSKQITGDQFVSQGVDNAKAYQGAAGDCAKQFPLQ